MLVTLQKHQILSVESRGKNLEIVIDNAHDKTWC